MAKKPIKEKQQIDFDLWILGCADEEIHFILKEISPIREYLPNIEKFFYWLCSYESYFDKHYSKFMSLNKEKKFNDNTLRDEFISEFNLYINEFSKTEKAICFKTFLTILSKHLDAAKYCYEGAKKEKETNQFNSYSIEDYWIEYNCLIILEELQQYFENQFNKSKHNLPFNIINKSIDVIDLIDENPNLNWKIELSQNNNATNTTKDIVPIQWNNNINQLAYLFWKLKKENIIENKNLGLTLSKIFIGKNKTDIKNTILNKHFSDFEKSNAYPEKTKEIDAFVNSIKEFYQNV